MPSRLALPALLVLGSVAALAAPAGDEVKLTKVSYDDFLAKMAANKGAKLTVVDAWATWCGPCKTNFPHVVEMHKKYADKGLAVVSLTLDDPSEKKAMAEAESFLKEKGATFPNYVLDLATDAALEKLNIGVIPAVFFFGPDGKEIKRFTLEDVDHPFTYDDVEKEVRERLGVK